MKTAPSFATVKLTDFVAAQAGDVGAQAELRLAVIYTAYYHILKAGNRTQWDMLAASCKQYADITNVKSALGVTRLTKEAKHMQRVYLSYGAALAAVGVPGVMKKADHAALDSAAAVLAAEFVSIVDAGMSDALSPEAQAEAQAKKEAAKAERDAKKAEAAQAEAAKLAETIKAEAAKLAEAAKPDEVELSPAELVRAVVSMIKAGALDSSALAELDDALSDVATSVETIVIPVADVQPEAMAA